MLTSGSSTSNTNNAKRASEQQGNGGSLAVTAIQPLSPNPKVAIHSAELYSPVLNDATLVDAQSITTKSLTVTHEVQLDCQTVLITGNVMVYGSVMGTGPYVDASDKRLKENVSPIPASDALKKVLAMQGVSDPNFSFFFLF